MHYQSIVQILFIVKLILSNHPIALLFYIFIKIPSLKRKDSSKIMKESFLSLFKTYLAAFCPAILPNTVISAIALLPNLFAPWIPPVTSPAANNPSITFPSVSNT